MLGLMQDWPLLVSKILDHAAINHPEQEIVTRTTEGPIQRYTYKDLHSRARQMAKRLEMAGVKLGDRIATCAWNNARHMEVWYGVMGMGAICHTVNPRLFPEQIEYIINHAEDSYVFVDLTFVPVFEAIAKDLPKVKGFVIMTDAAHMPDTKLRDVICYEDWLAEADDDYTWPTFDENTAAGLCYTSGTTGNPKGVLYSHRSNVLHALLANQADTLGLCASDVILPVVPMFHANAWAIAFGAPAAGAKLVMPGPKMDGESIYQLLHEEGVTVSAAVPTVWLMLLGYLEDQGKELPLLNYVVIGGSACPPSMIEAFETKYGVQVFHAWGMTEMSPIGTLGRLKPKHESMSLSDQIALKSKQGRAPFTVEMKIVDDEGNEQPRDGVAFGHLVVRGPAVSKSYLKGEGGEILDADGWFDTGDVATIDADGYMQITDRAKDVIKSGGEWISTIEIENIAVGHPGVAEAAVIGLPHPKWDERPLLIVVAKDGTSPSGKDILAYLEGKIAKWWMPNDVAFVDEIPHTATGKIQKMDLRAKFKDHQLPND